MIYFQEKEFYCCPDCDLGLSSINARFLKMLDNAREISGVPYKLNSTIRCDKHNLDVGGSTTSSHLIGVAADIKCVTSYDRCRIMTGLIAAGFTRLGVGAKFIHCDADTSKPRSMVWVY